MLMPAAPAPTMHRSASSTLPFGRVRASMCMAGCRRGSVREKGEESALARLGYRDHPSLQHHRQQVECGVGAGPTRATGQACQRTGGTHTEEPAPVHAHVRNTSVLTYRNPESMMIVPTVATSITLTSASSVSGTAA